MSSRRARRRIQAMAVSVFWLAASAPGLNAEAAPVIARTLSLREAQRLALAGNWDVLAAESDVQSAAAQRRIAGEFQNPSLSVSTGKIPGDRGSLIGPAGGAFWSRSYDTVFSLSQPLEMGGKRRARRESADWGREAAAARLQDARRQTAAAVTRSYAAALLAGAAAEINRASANALQKSAMIAAARLAAGDISQSDADQVVVAANRFSADAEVAATAAVAARSQLLLLLGPAAPAPDMALSDRLESIPLTGRNLSAAAVPADRPDLAAADFQYQRAAADFRLQQKAVIPDLLLQSQYEHQPPDQRNTLGIGVSLSIPLWNRYRGEIDLAAAARIAAGRELAMRRAQAQDGLARARAAHTTALSRIRRYREEILPPAQRAERSVAFAYEKGSASLLELLEAERGLNEIRLAAAQAGADAIAAAADLAAALNVRYPDSP